MTSRSVPSSTSADDVAREAITTTYRDGWGRLLAQLVAHTRRLDLVEDALAEAFARASARWPIDGVPDRPEAWLLTVARRTVVGRLRSEAVAGRRAPLLAVRGAVDTPDPLAVGDAVDDRVALVLLCAHPALDPSSRAALALRLVMGTPTDEIARLFLVPTATMAARLTRAKRRIVSAGIPFREPDAALLAERIDTVARTVYLAFTAGYTPGSGDDLLRADLAGDAVRLAAVLRTLLPDQPVAAALHALLAAQHARRDARVRDGALVPLAEQDRSRWYHDEIAAAVASVDALPASTGYAEELRLQALIACAHATAATAADTEWGAIADRYEALERLTGSPVVRLNRAVAVAECDGPAAGLALLDGLDRWLGEGHRLHAVRAELWHRSGDGHRARAAFDLAIARCRNEVERRYLVRRRAQT